MIKAVLYRRLEYGDFMRVLFYDSGCGALGIQYLIPTVRSCGHDVFVYLDPSLIREYVAQDFFLKKAFAIPPRIVLNDILAYRPDIVCFSMASFYYHHYLSLIQLLKKEHPEIIIICGGIHTTLVPEGVLENREIDFAVVGEAEYSLCALVNALADVGVNGVKSMPVGALPGVWNVHSGGIVDRGLSPIPTDLDALAFPSKKEVYQANPLLAYSYSTSASRGCLFHCTYCNSASLRDLYAKSNIKHYRTRSVDNVITELRVAKAEYNTRHIEFYDDVFAANRSWLEEFSAKYRAEIGIPYGVETHPMMLDKERIKLLADSGCVVLELGLQSANQQVRETILERHDQNKKVKQIIRWADEAGIGIELDLIANLPGETPEHIREALDFIYDARPHIVNLAFLQYLPKTRIIDKAIERGVLSPEDIPRINAGQGLTPHRSIPEYEISDAYRVLPTQVFIASRLPAYLSRPLVSLSERWVFRKILSAFVPMLMYAFRIYLALCDRRNYYLRWHLVRILYSMHKVLARRFFGCYSVSQRGEE